MTTPADIEAEFESLQWIPVLSTNLSQVSYCPSTERLWVQFVAKKGNPTVYYYDEVPQKVFSELTTTESHGKYFCSEVKGKYGYTQYR